MSSCDSDIDSDSDCDSSAASENGAVPGQGRAASDDNVGSRCEVLALSQYQKGSSIELVEGEKYKPVDFDKYAPYALVLVSRFNNKGEFHRRDLKINSQALLGVFRQVIGTYPTVPSDFKSPFEVTNPYVVLYHYWDELRAYRRHADDETEMQHLDLLLEFMDDEMSRQRKEVDTNLANGAITFDAIWTIFRPGQLVLSTEVDHQCLARLEKAYYAQCGTVKCFTLQLLHTLNDGTGIFWRSTSISISEAEFGGGAASKVVELPAFPSHFLPDETDVLKALEERGRRCLSMAGVKTLRYDGPAKYQTKPPTNYHHPNANAYRPTWLPCRETGRVVLDGETFLEECRFEKEGIRRWMPVEYARWAKKAFPSEEVANLTLCAPTVYGYSMDRKAWCKFYVDNLQPVKWKEDAISSLIMSQEQKDLMVALVTSHNYPDNAREIAEQKGKGLVILLHGTPGSGKTLSAEVAAETAHVALMTITLGELYKTDGFAESKLVQLLQYATVWRAIVLIDEADVFLETRTGGGSQSSERNALVAVFLKCLEYFSGIAFLTSNRVEDFDPAMKSRIHLALQYSPPIEQLRSRIWSSRLSNVPSQDIAIDIPQAVGRLARYDLNGREIANHLNTARTLARHRGVKLELAHLETVVKVWQEFNRDLDVLKGKPKQNGERLAINGTE